MKQILEKLTFAVFEFVLVPERTMEFTGFKGNAFRGALGKTLRNLTCVFKGSATPCKECLVREQCIYSKLFESPHLPDGSVLGHVENAPHPFVLYVPDPYRLEYPGQSQMHFFLTLLGEAMEYIPYFILVFEELGQLGLGSTRTPFKIETVRCNGTPIYHPAEKRISTEHAIYRGLDFGLETWPEKTLIIELLTPTRLKFEKQLQKFITFEMLIRNLLRRIQLLSALYCGGPERVDFREQIDQAKNIQITDSQIHWEQQTRFSFRQEQNVALGGVSGWVKVVGDVAPFMPYLRIGEFLHVGKSTAFGLGKIRIGKSDEKE